MAATKTESLIVEAAEKDSLSAYGTARSTVSGKPLSAEALQKIHAYWRACNYLSLGVIYLQDNPLLQEALKPEHIKKKLLGHWGASPGPAFVYIHLNKLIKKNNLDMIFLAGPWARAPVVLGTVLQVSWARCTWRVPTPRFTPRRARIRPGCRSSSSNSRFRAASAVTVLLKRRARSMREASSGMSSLMPAALPSTIPA